MALHEKDVPLAGSVESTLRQAATAGIVADADFATDLATTLANVDTRNANVKPENYAMYLAAKEAIKVGFNVLGATVMITDLATIYAACPGGDWAPGFAVTI